MSVFQRNGGKWYYRFQLNGKEYYRACKGAVTKKDAEMYEAIVKAELMKGNLGIIENKVNTRLKEAIDLYLKYSETNKRSYRTDIYHTNNFLKFFKNIDLQDITPSLIEKFKQDLKNKNLKNATINRHLQAMSKMFNLCVANGLIDKNPLKDVRKLKEDNHTIRFLTKEEETILFQYLPKHIKPIVICALKTGMRRGEILNLKWENINSDFSCIELLQTKSGKKRKIPISTKLREILLEIKKINNTVFVFVNPQTQKPYTDIKKSFMLAVKKSGIKKFRFHDLRHTFATRLIEKGVDIIVAKELLGHADVKTTMRYVHSDAERKAKAIDIIDLY